MAFLIHNLENLFIVCSSVIEWNATEKGLNACCEQGPMRCSPLFTTLTQWWGSLMKAPSRSQGADKTVKGPDGLTALEATDNQAIKALLQ